MTHDTIPGYAGLMISLMQLSSEDRAWPVLQPLIRHYPHYWVHIAKVMGEKRIGAQLEARNEVQKLWHLVAGQAVGHDGDPVMRAQWHSGASALLDVLVGDQVPREFAQDCMGDSGNPLYAARSLPVLVDLVRRMEGEPEVDRFWRYAGDQLLGWIMKMDDVEALDELLVHATPQQGLTRDGSSSWIQAWITKRLNIPYVPNNTHGEMLDRLAQWGVDVDRTHTNLTTLELAAQDLAYLTRCKETIHALLSVGARWEALERKNVSPIIDEWLAEHPAVRKERLGELVHEVRDTGGRVRKI